MKPIIEVNNISKKYKIGKAQTYQTLRDTIVDSVKHPFGIFQRNKLNSDGLSDEEFWALKNVSFSVNEGEVLGIIGRNGAGKSTLLKILSRITPPTEGEIIMRGRVASLLEVGTGFQGELTGRENIFLNGAILGMSQKEIKKKFDAIVDFAEIEKFLDTPVKRYSSGMYTRLAFAVAAHLEPEILIIDEVLAVGDTQFQRKCLGKMEELSHKGGRTVIFVSHNMGAISSLCNRTIILNKGKIIYFGNTAKAINTYFSIASISGVRFENIHDDRKKINLRKVILTPDKKNPSENINFDDNFIIRVEYEVNRCASICIVQIQMLTSDGNIVFCTADYDMNNKPLGTKTPGYYQSDIYIPGKLFSPNTFIINVGINSDSGTDLYDRIDTIKFNIVDNGTTPKSLHGEALREGILQPLFKWKTAKIK